MAFLSKNQIEALGFSSVGGNVQLSDKASFYNCKNISIGDNSRIDDFAVLSAGEGGIEIGRHVHLAIGVSIQGAAKVLIEDFCGLSSRVSVYSSNDDYSGKFMTGPTIPSNFTNVTHGPVAICRHAIIGSGTVILPNVKINEGVAIGALSLITKDCEAFGVYIGTPAKKIKERKKDLLELEKQLLSTEN